MAMREIEAVFTVTVKMHVEEEVIARTQTDEWKDYLYDLDEEGAIEMIARCVGIMDCRLTALDGWADMDDSAVVIERVDYDLESVIESGV